MLNRIVPNAPPSVDFPGLPPLTSAGSGDTFPKVINDAISRVENHRAGAGQSIDRFVPGEQEDVHRVALTTQQAGIAFETFLQVKNKVVEAYQEIMRMQL